MITEFLLWRLAALAGPVSADRLVQETTVESLPYGAVPEKHYRGMVRFRHLRFDQRLRKCEHLLGNASLTRRVAAR